MTKLRFARRRRRLLLVAAAVGSLATGTQFVDATASPPAPVPVLAWADCGDGLQCATASVPLDHSRPQDKHIDLAVIRQPATDPSRRIGSLFVNNGGPGNSVLEFVRGDARQVLSPELQARFDIVGFDPRGVGQSTPARCFADAGAQQAFFGSRPAFPVGAAEVKAFTAGSRDLGRNCRQRNGELLEHLSTANVARDLDLLRKAVGDKQLSYVGYSYGGLLGITYAGLFPGKVRALMLDGLPDPVEFTRSDPTAKKAPMSVRVGSPEATSGAMGFFLDACQAAGDGCAFAAPDTRAKFDALMARLRQGPVTIEFPGGSLDVSHAFLVDALRGALQFPPIWAEVAENLEATFQASQGHAARTAAVAGMTRARAATVAPADGYDNSAEAFLAVACSESRNPADPREWPEHAAAADEKAPYFGADWAYLLQPCATWRARDDDRYSGPFNRPTANPVLFVNARFDAASNYQKARRTANALPGARLLTLDGAGHPASFVPNTCIDGSITRYLVDQQLPADGAVCQPEFRPFS